MPNVHVTATYDLLLLLSWVGILSFAFSCCLFFPIDELAHRVLSIHFLLLLPFTGINLMCSRDERLELVCNDFFSAFFGPFLGCFLLTRSSTLTTWLMWIF